MIQIPSAFQLLEPGGVRKPAALRPGDKVGIFSPSYPAASQFPDRLERSARALAKAFEVETIVSPQTFSRSGFTAGSAKQRAGALMDLIEDDSIRAIFCATGGFNSAELLPLLNKETVRNHLKIFVGYSDCSALLCGLQALGGWCTFHGPTMLPQFGEFPDPLAYTVRQLRNAVVEPSPQLEISDPASWTDEFLDWEGSEWMTRPRRLQTDAGRTVWREGSGTGLLFGGNLETINFLVGTPYLVLPEAMVFFWEATEEEAFLPRIRRALAQFKQVGILGRVRAMLVGKSPHSRSYCETTLRDVVMEQVAEFDFPVVANLAFGHTDPMFTFPLGIQAAVRTTAKSASLIIQEAGVAIPPP